MDLIIPRRSSYCPNFATAPEQLSSNENHAALKSLIGSGYALDLDRAYERGLALMVDGIFSRLARTR